MLCSKCGKENAEGNTFCQFCGASTSSEAPASASGQGAMAPGAPGLTPPPMVAKPKKGKGLILGLGAGLLVVIAAIVLVLVLVVFKSSDSSAAGPEKTVTGFMQAAVQGDFTKMLSYMDPQSADMMKTYADMYGIDLEGALSEAFSSEMAPGATDMQIKDLEFKTTINGDEATVEIVGGTATYRDDNGKLVEKDLGEEGSLSVPLKKQNGTWYIDFMQMGLQNSDSSGL